MRYILTSAVLVVLLFPALALGETMELKDLLKRDGLYYKKFTDVPFTGKITGIVPLPHSFGAAGRQQGSLKDGEKDGPWVSYYYDGQVRYKGT